MFVLTLPARPGTIDDLLLVRYWLRQLARVHFANANSNSLFPNLALVEALFPSANERESIFFSLGIFKIQGLNNSMLPSVRALMRIRDLRCGSLRTSGGGFKTVFNELLLASKHGIEKAAFSWNSVIDLPVVGCLFLQNNFFSI
jgi:hypothetical protein